MKDVDELAAGFEAHRPHLRAVAYRMLGSLADADDAVQEAWLRYRRTDTAEVEKLGAWLTTVVARICLNVLRSRRTRREEPLPLRLPDPIIAAETDADPQHEILLADAVGMALQVVLERLRPAERVAFVLHDVFGMPFEEVASIVGRSPSAARQLASRGRRRVRRSRAIPDAGLREQRAVVDAFRAASRGGDLHALLAVLDPDVVVRADYGAASTATGEVHGAQAVAESALGFAPLARFARTALVNGAPGFVVVRDGAPFAVLAFTVSGGRIVELDVVADPVRLRQLDLSVLDD
jgi:RNA polymerase sigma factor (sigma-70 family)